jgi:hypothetical protein
LRTSNHFSLNTHKVISRAFPFIDRGSMQSLALLGAILINHRAVANLWGQCKVGDFIRIIPSVNFAINYSFWLECYEDYLGDLGQGLYQHFKTQKQKKHKRRKNHLAGSALFNDFYKPAPHWMEVSYLTLSVFIISPPTKLAFDSVGYNPYLSRLLAF